MAETMTGDTGFALVIVTPPYVIPRILQFFAE